MHRCQQVGRNALRFRYAIEPGLILERLIRREKGIEDDLLWHDTDRIFGVAWIGVDVEAPDARMPARLVDEPCQDVDQRRLARTVRPEQPENLTTRHVETDIVERLLAAGIEFGDGVDADGGFGHAPCHSRAPAPVKAFMCGHAFAQRRVNAMLENAR